MGRIVCEGSGQEPAVTTTDGHGRYALIGGVEYGIGYDDRELCAKCAKALKPLKTGLMPKHTRYVSWKEQQAMKAAGGDFEMRSR